MSIKMVLALPSIPFTQRRRLLPDAPGLYFVVADDQDVLYVGMSRKSIQRRWKTWHHVVYDIQDSGLSDRAKIAYLVYSDAEALLDAEQMAIREFRPPFNFGHGEPALSAWRAALEAPSPGPGQPSGG